MNMVVIFTVLLSVLMVMCLLNMLTKSSFTEYGTFVGQTDEKGIQEQLNEKYSIPCSEPRAYPSGHVSGNYLNLNGPQRQELLINFIKDKN